jgi:hypothetical protein
VTAFPGAKYINRPELKGSWQVHCKPQPAQAYPADYHGVYYDRERMAPFPTKDPRMAPF